MRVGLKDILKPENLDIHKNRMVPLFLMAAYAYYVEGEPIMSDGEFDNLAKTMLDNWEEIVHYHKYLISEDMLRAGTYLGDYPLIVVGALENYRRES